MAQAGTRIKRPAGTCFTPLLITLMLLAAAVSLEASAESSLRLEGIIADASDPEDSLALVNGQALKKGDSIEGHRVLRIGPDFIDVAVDGEGREYRLAVTAAPAPALSAAPSEPLPAPGWGDSMRRWWKSAWSPAKKDTQEGPKVELWERIAVASLIQMHEAVSRFQEQNKKPPVSFEELIRDAGLPERYHQGKYGKYRFTLAYGSPEPGIHAAPLPGNPPLKFFFMDSQQVLHMEEDREADARSAVYNPELGKSR
jgi:hypothetical protein